MLEMEHLPMEGFGIGASTLGYSGLISRGGQVSAQAVVWTAESPWLLPMGLEPRSLSLFNQTQLGHSK